MLSQSEHLLRRITDALPVLISYVDRDCCYRFNNARYRDWFGLDPEAVQGKHIVDVVGETSFAAIKPLIEQALSGHQAHFEGWLPYTHGGLRCVSADYIPDTDQHGETHGCFALVTDITARRATDERLEMLRQDNQRRLDEIQALFDAAPIGIFFARDQACENMTMNQAGARLLRMPLERNPSKSGPEAQQLPFRVFQGPHELAPHELPMQQAAASGHTVNNTELTLAFADGSTTHLLTYAAPLFDEQGQARGSIGTFVDVSEHKRLEARLRQQTQDLETMNRRKDQFLAMLGHELRNPLTPIRSAVYLLRMPDHSAEQTAWAADMIERQVGHLQRMVDDLLDVARVRRGTLSLTCEQRPLQPLLLESIAALRPAMEEKSQELALNLPQTPVIVFGDGIRLTQVFSNLLHNACRYTPEDGRIMVSLQTTGNQARIDVEDNGKGISPDLLPHVFDIFDSAISHRDRTHAGLGLGLTLVKQIVTLHGGQVTVKSDGSDHGCRFTVWLPLIERATTSHDRDAIKGIAGLHGQSERHDQLKILVVDDNLDILESIAGLLRGLGHQVRVLDAGARVIRTVREHPVDVILLDIGLPDVDGYQVARVLAKEPGRSQLSVIAITGYADSAPTDLDAATLFDARLLKPFTLAQLEPLLRQQHRRKHGRIH
ncbi:hybrid sensor histidine kinase/response regulator [Rhabdochromatium marinum]|uniref:hybrid sensor histidine kinase/response regulator n=1 Tax=Rhabdochromatium marinum TaxID=48729 RepID=UPI00190875FD|nr:ATP-binding protein [Rhabdochromatium marinum]MBK1649436.1 hypothetical protein [Rhabdochromatium marinum]